MTYFRGDEANFFFFKKKNQNVRLKKTEFFNFAEQFLPKFYGLVLGLVGLIDAKGIDFAQPIALSM